MLIIYKKKLKLFTVFFIILLFFLSVILLFGKNINKKYINVSSTPISNHTIILDAGHGYPDGGATGNSGKKESEINLEIVLKLQKILETSGCVVLLTRSDENGIYSADASSIREQKISDMKNRVKIANTSDAELFISIHMNKLEQKSVSGWQTFFKNDDEISKILASNIQKNLNMYMPKKSTKEIKSISNIYLTKNVEIPLVLVECGFLSNEEENILLHNADYQNKLVWSIYSGIMDYFAE